MGWLFDGRAWRFHSARNLGTFDGMDEKITYVRVITF